MDVRSLLLSLNMASKNRRETCLSV